MKNLLKVITEKLKKPFYGYQCLELESKLEGKQVLLLRKDGVCLLSSDVIESQSGLIVYAEWEDEEFHTIDCNYSLRWDGTIKLRDPETSDSWCYWLPVSGFTEDELEYLESKRAIIRQEKEDELTSEKLIDILDNHTPSIIPYKETSDEIDS